MVGERNTARVLLVDDRQDNVLALEASLQGMPVRPVRAFGGEEALKRLLTDDFALILLDVQMPGMDGFETAQHIKQRERTRHVPIIFLTAADREAHLAMRGYAAGAVDYLTKPFDPWILRSKVAVFVELWSKTQQLRENAEACHSWDRDLRASLEAVTRATELTAGVRAVASAGTEGECWCRQPSSLSATGDLQRIVDLLDQARARLTRALR